MIEWGYTLQFRRRPPRFNGVVQSLTSPRNAQALRQEIGCLLEKGAVERVPPNELESGFYSRYFVVPKRDGGLRPILDLRPINRALCKRPFRMITLKQILAQIRPGDWFASVDLKDAYFHIQIAPHHRRFLRFAFENTAYQYSVLPFGLALAPRTFSKCVDAALSPLRASGMRILNYLDDWLILAQSRGHATQPYRLAAYSLGVPRAMCKQAKEHSRPESVHYVSGSLHGLPGNESPPLARALGGHFVLPAPFQRRQLCSSEKNSETAGTHGVSFGSMSSGLITHATTAAVAENSSPLDSMDFGTFEYHGHLRLHRSSGSVAQPGSLQPGSPPGVGDFTRGGHNRRIDARLGSGVRGNASFGAVVGTSDPMAHKPLGIGSSLFSSKGVSSTTGTATCTDSYINRQGGIRSKVLCEQAAILLLWADSRLLSIRATHIPGLLNRGADMLSRRRIPQGEWRLHPESVQMIWNLYGEAEVDLFATSENAHCPLFFSLSHSPLKKKKKKKGTRSQRTGRQPGFMRFLRSKYCLWCYARSGRSERL